jgi:hypothetical protein
MDDDFSIPSDNDDLEELSNDVLPEDRSQFQGDPIVPSIPIPSDNEELELSNDAPTEVQDRSQFQGVDPILVGDDDDDDLTNEDYVPLSNDEE